MTFLAQVILEKLGIDVEVYHASEIDEDAIYVSKFHHPHIFHHGDIKDIVKNEQLIESLCPINFLIGGSPCEELSQANPNGMKLGEISWIFIKIRIYYTKAS